MNIEFVRRYKSIENFENTTIENFSVLTGKNGSGKTHLLKAIKDGSVKVNNLDQEFITYFNFQTFLIKNQRVVTMRDIDDEKTQAWNMLKNDLPTFKSYDQSIQGIVGSIEDPYKQTNQIDDYNRSIRLILERLNQLTGNNFKLAHLMKTGIFESGKYFSEIDEHTFKRASNYEPEDYQLLENLSELFIDYKKKIILGKISREDGGHGMSDEEVNLLEENAPWIFINKMFKEFGLKHSVLPPNIRVGDLVTTQTVSFQTKLSLEDEEIDFDDLSSGEKILCSLAITVYQDNKSRFPKLLLLDEIDASLHPSMCKNLISVIENVFLKNGCDVIIATHSPTTVALVNEIALFEVQKGNLLNKIKKVSQIEAIDILSEGYMTFDEGLKITNAINDESKLQIITEGYNIDHIEKALSIIDNSLLNRINLITGAKGNTGKQQLKNAFDVMKSVNSSSVFLFVWDCDAEKIVESLTETSHFKTFCFAPNSINTKCLDKDGKHFGIEDLYNDDLFTEDVYHESVDATVYGGSVTKKIFDKTIFLNKVRLLTDVDKFKNFQPLIQKIQEIITAY